MTKKKGKYPYLKLRCGTVSLGGYGQTVRCREDGNRVTREACAECQRQQVAAARGKAERDSR